MSKKRLSKRRKTKARSASRTPQTPSHQVAKKWIFTPPAEFRMALLFLVLSASLFCFTETELLNIFLDFVGTKIKTSSQDVVAMKVVGRVFGAFFLILATPKAIVAPILNLRALLGVPSPKKGILKGIKSLFPIGYFGTAHRALIKSLEIHPCAKKFTRAPTVFVQTLPIHRKIYLEPYYIRKSMIFDIMLNLQSSPPVIEVILYVESDQDVRYILKLGWLKEIEMSLQATLAQSSFPYINQNWLRFYLHSEEEARRSRSHM